MNKNHMRTTVRLLALCAMVVGVTDATAQSPLTLAPPIGEFGLIDANELISQTDEGAAPLVDPAAGDQPQTSPTPLPPPVVDVAEDAASESAEAEEDDEEAAPTIEELNERLAEMEKGWEKYQEKLKKEAADKAKKPSMKIGGRVHLDAWSFLEEDTGIGYLENPSPTLNGAPNPAFGADPEDTVAFRRLRLEMQGDVPGNMSWRMQVDFNNPNEPEIKDAYIAWNELPLGQTLILGNQKRPIGLDHLNSSRFNVFAERPLAVEAFNEDARRLGLAMYGYDEETSVNWRYGIYNLENISGDGRYIGDSLQLGGYGRLAASPWYDEVSGGRGYQHLGIAASVARPDGDVRPGESNSNEARFRTRPQARTLSRWLDTGRINGADWFEQIGVESITNIGALQITGEYLATFVQRTVGGPSDDLAFHGGYVYVSYFLTGEHMTYERDSSTLGRVKPFENFFLVDRCNGCYGRGWGAWQVALRYDYLDLTDSNIRGGVEHNYTLGLNWHWTAYSKLQTNLIYGTIDDHRPITDPNLGATFTGGDFWILGSRFMIDF